MGDGHVHMDETPVVDYLEAENRKTKQGYLWTSGHRCIGDPIKMLGPVELRQLTKKDCEARNSTTVSASGFHHKFGM